MGNDKIKTQPLAFNLQAQGEMQESASNFYNMVRSRRTVRDFSNKPVPKEIIENCLRAAGTAPSGANHQPWHFVVISDPELKHKIREGAEEEEREFYESRAPQDWLDALAPLGTDANKPFLEIAPYLIVIFGEKFSFDTEGNKLKNYYVSESVGIATGILITALHNAGLASLTHTPAPMKFLSELVGRPATEKPYMILVTGYPAENAEVPAITRKSLEEIASFRGDD
ncbi:MAG: nitroreductase family protein [Gammaproteobacteria bacterium]|jgi:nitroreductase|nr:nitroreductase family protein [Gammaproteobacteria bacterium]